MQSDSYPHLIHTAAAGQIKYTKLIQVDMAIKYHVAYGHPQRRGRGSKSRAEAERKVQRERLYADAIRGIESENIGLRLIGDLA